MVDTPFLKSSEWPIIGELTEIERFIYELLVPIYE